MEPRPDLFKGLTFYLEIFTDGTADNEVFKKALIEHGGKVSKLLTKNVTHVVWSQGRARTLEKALDYESIKIVSSLWLQESFTEMKLADEKAFRPGAVARLEEKRKKRQHQEISRINKGLANASATNKKRSQVDCD